MGIPGSRISKRVQTLAAHQKNHTFPSTVLPLLDGDKVLNLRTMLNSLNRDNFDNADSWKTGYEGLDEKKIGRF